MNRTVVVRVAVWVLSVVLALLFVLAAAPKMLRLSVWIDKFSSWGYSEWFVVTIGVLELLGAVLLLIPRLAFIGVGLLAVIMLGAGYTHIANGEGLEVIRPAVFLSLLLVVGWARRPGRVETPSRA